MPVVDVESPLDPHLAPYRQLSDADLTARAGLFVAEGRRVVERLLGSTRLTTQSVLVTPTAYGAMTSTLGERPDLLVLRASQAIMDEVSGFNIHRGCLALARRPVDPGWATLIADARLIVVLEGVGDADNVGSTFRNASAFGVDAVLMGPSCADPLYRKAIRTSMAATLAVPFARIEPWPDALRPLGASGWRVVGLTPHGAPPLQDVVGTDTDAPLALLFGTEGDGLSAGALAACTTRASIPMAVGHDSLNVAVSAAVALYEVTRERLEGRA